MKTIIGTLLALGLLSTSASAWYCPPGYNSGYGHKTYSYAPSYGHKTYQKPTYDKVEKKIIEKPAYEAPPAPVEPAPAPEQK